MSTIRTRARVRLAWWVFVLTGGNGTLCRLADRLAPGVDR